MECIPHDKGRVFAILNSKQSTLLSITEIVEMVSNSDEEYANTLYEALDVLNIDNITKWRQFRNGTSLQSVVMIFGVAFATVVDRLCKPIVVFNHNRRYRCNIVSIV
jgi:hypothetical protein